MCHILRPRGSGLIVVVVRSELGTFDAACGHAARHVSWQLGHAVRVAVGAHSLRSLWPLSSKSQETQDERGRTCTVRMSPEAELQIANCFFR